MGSDEVCISELKASERLRPRIETISDMVCRLFVDRAERSSAMSSRPAERGLRRMARGAASWIGAASLRFQEDANRRSYLPGCADCQNPHQVWP